MAPALSRASGKVVVKPDDGPAIRLTPDRCEAVAMALLQATHGTVPSVTLEEPRSEGYMLRVVSRPDERLVILANTGKYGDGLAWWDFAEVRQAAAEILRLAVDLELRPKRRPRAQKVNAA